MLDIFVTLELSKFDKSISVILEQLVNIFAQLVKKSPNINSIRLLVSLKI